MKQKHFDFAASTFGPAFNPSLDGQRIGRQLDEVRDYMLRQKNWCTLAEISKGIGHPEASISAQLRHLRKPKFGGYIVEKRRRPDRYMIPGGTWEYRVNHDLRE